MATLVIKNIGKIVSGDIDHPVLEGSVIVINENLIEAIAHIGGADVGEKAEAAAIHPEDRYRVGCRKSCGMQHRAIAADGDDQVRVRTEILLVVALDLDSLEIDRSLSID